MIVIGADWCPSCVLFAKMVANDPSASKLHSKFVVVELNGELKSTKALARKLNFSFVAFPQAFIIKPKANEVIQQFFPSSYNSVDSLLAIIGVSSSPTLRNKPKEVGNVLVSSLE
jgi:thiol-disulfide isomerase/thioredoxin